MKPDAMALGADEALATGGPRPTCDLKHWRARFAASRQARAQRTDDWAAYARLHARAAGAARVGELAIHDGDDAPRRADKTRLGLVHRNVQQTLGVLEAPEITITATAVEFAREMDQQDEHAEDVVTAALTNSLRDSGFLRGPELADLVKQAAILCGHGAIYTSWAVHAQDEPVGQVAVYTKGPDGALEPVLDDDGEPLVKPLTERRVIREGPRDAFVSPLDFLFDPTAPSIDLSDWHAWERIMRLDDLRADPRFQIPDGLEEGTHSRVDLYGDQSDTGTGTAVEKGVAIIIAFDKPTRELCFFLAQDPGAAERLAPRSAEGRAGSDLVCIGCEPLPPTFDSPDDSPFSTFVPIPALDDPFGVSQIAHVRIPARQADVLSSRIDTQTLGQKRILAFDKGSGLDEDQIRKAMSAPDFVVVGIDNPMGHDLSRVLAELPMQHPTPEAFEGIKRGKDDVAGTSGVTDVPYGGASTATESENLMAVGSARINRKRRLYLDFVARVARAHLAYLAAFAPDGQRALVPDLFGQQTALPYGREAFSRARFNLKAVPGGQASAKSPVQAKGIMDGLGMMAPMAGPALRVWMAEQAAMTLGLEDLGRMRRALYADAQMGPAGPAAAGGIDGRLRADGPALANAEPGQVIRAATNALNEGRAG